MLRIGASRWERRCAEARHSRSEVTRHFELSIVRYGSADMHPLLQETTIKQPPVITCILLEERRVLAKIVREFFSNYSDLEALLTINLLDVTLAVAEKSAASLK